MILTPLCASGRLERECIVNHLMQAHVAATIRRQLLAIFSPGVDLVKCDKSQTRLGTDSGRRMTARWCRRGNIAASMLGFATEKWTLGLVRIVRCRRWLVAAHHQLSRVLQIEAVQRARSSYGEQVQHVRARGRRVVGMLGMTRGQGEPTTTAPLRCG